MYLIPIQNEVKRMCITFLRKKIQYTGQIVIISAKI